MLNSLCPVSALGMKHPKEPPSAPWNFLAPLDQSGEFAARVNNAPQLLAFKRSADLLQYFLLSQSQSG